MAFLQAMVNIIHMSNKLKSFVVFFKVLKKNNIDVSSQSITIIVSIYHCQVPLASLTV